MGVIMHKGVAYGGGSNVEANPTGSASDDLSKLGIDGTVYDITDADAVHSTDIGVASGVAGLDSNGKVPTAQLPTYPTVNNGTLTIQKNGSTVATFTANQSGNSNANISVPTQPSDINAAAESDIESTKSTSGNPITITDAAPINAESLVVELEPIQDLHGQSYPYVGGAGKNKCPLTMTTQTVNNVTYTVNDDGTISLSGTASGGFSQVAIGQISLPAGSYITSDGLDVTRNGDFEFYISGNADSSTATADNKQFTLSEGISNKNVFIFVKNGVNTNGKVVKPMIRLSTETDATFVPYSNICPISGYDSVSVDDVGKNLLDNSTFEKGRVDNGVIGYASGTDSLTVENGGVTFTVNTAWRGVVSGLVKVDGNTKYCLSYTATNDYVAFVNCYDANGDWISPSLNNVSGVFTTNANTAFINVSFQKRTTGTVNVSNLQLEKGSTATTYEPYHSSNATIQFGQTVYGGTVDFKTGVVTITDANIASYAGETLPSTWISDRDAYSSGGTPTTGAQVVYKLSTPTTLQLTPQELKLLQNTNNITTDGTTINLGYQQNNVVGELKADMESHIDMPWLQVLNSGQAIDFNDFLLLDDSGVTITFTLANLEVFKHRFLFVEIYRKQDDYDSYINASLLLNVATLYSAKNGYNSSFGMNGGITAVFNFIIKYEQGNYKIKMSINTNASSPLTDIYIRARLVD